jgi:hypothetical protein
MVEPIPIPAALYYDWYEYIPHLHSAAEFELACLQDNPAAGDTLREWSVREMLSHGDPLQGLADFINQLVISQQRNPPQRENSPLWKRLFFQSNKRQYFNPVTHENDVFSDVDVEVRVDAWKKILQENQMSANA